MEPLNDLLKQPWSIQVALASGYTAYMVSFTGVRSHHKAVDIGFGTLTLGLVASAALFLLSGLHQPLLAGCIAFGLTVAFGLVWRRWLGRCVRWLLRKYNFSWSDDTPSALTEVTNNTEFGLSQIGVLLKDGTWLSCADASVYRAAPFGPCRIGVNGDIALYVDRKKLAGEDEVEVGNVFNDEFGTRITYIPADKIERLTFRQKRLNRRERAAA